MITFTAMSSRTLLSHNVLCKRYQMPDMHNLKFIKKSNKQNNMTQEIRSKILESNVHTGALISPYSDQEENKLQREKILIFIQPIYNHNWRNISTVYIYIYK